VEKRRGFTSRSSLELLYVNTANCMKQFPNPAYNLFPDRDNPI